MTSIVPESTTCGKSMKLSKCQPILNHPLFSIALIISHLPEEVNFITVLPSPTFWVHIPVQRVVFAGVVFEQPPALVTGVGYEALCNEPHAPEMGRHP